MRACAAAVAGAVLAAAGGGCASTQGPASVEIEAGQFGEAFVAARETLRELRFPLERVDAAEGVITTSAKASSGLATPWDREQSSLSQEVEDLLNHQSRRVRITFVPREEAGATAEDRWAGAVRAQVDASVYRTQTGGLRVPSRSVGDAAFTADLRLRSTGQSGAYEVAVSRDERLSARIARAIEARLARQSVPGAGEADGAAGGAAEGVR